MPWARMTGQSIRSSPVGMSASIAPPEQLPEGVGVGEPVAQRPGLRLGRAPRRRPQPRQQGRAAEPRACDRRDERAQAAQRQAVGPHQRPGRAAPPGVFMPEGEIATTDRARWRTASSSAMRGADGVAEHVHGPTPSSSRSATTASVIAAIVGRPGERGGAGRGRAGRGRRRGTPRRGGTQRGEVGVRAADAVEQEEGSPEPARSQNSRVVITCRVPRAPTACGWARRMSITQGVGHKERHRPHRSCPAWMIA